MIKVLIVFGTRPEAIKMAPLVKEFEKFPANFETKVCVTAQHREMLDQVLEFFEILPDFDLNLMKPNQTLDSITASILLEMKTILEIYKPDYVFVHGDTTTSMSVALSAFYNGCKVAHVEAGLRTYDKHSPFPEEINRQITARLADLHFAPTVKASENLISEGVDVNGVFVTGNTVIDALVESVKKVNSHSYSNTEIDHLKSFIDPHKKIVLVTGHRRENFGEGFIRICEAIKEIAERADKVQIIYPVHLNPNVQTPVIQVLGNIPNIHLTSPLSYPSFVWLLGRANIIVTDSGGIQEEAPSLGKPVLVMRETTERPEAVDSGTVVMVGTDKAKIVTEALSLLQDDDRYLEMSRLNNPYGDGLASKRIVNYLRK